MQSAVSSLTAEPPLLSSAQLRSHWARMLGEQPAASSSQSASGSQQHLPPGADMLTTCINSGYQPRNMSWELALTDKMPALKAVKAWWSAANDTDNPVTLVTQLSVDRLHQLAAQCHAWAGRLSAVVYLAVPAYPGANDDAAESASESRGEQQLLKGVVTTTTTTTTTQVSLAISNLVKKASSVFGGKTPSIDLKSALKDAGERHRVAKALSGGMPTGALGRAAAVSGGGEAGDGEAGGAGESASLGARRAAAAAAGEGSHASAGAGDAGADAPGADGAVGSAAGGSASGDPGSATSGAVGGSTGPGSARRRASRRLRGEEGSQADGFVWGGDPAAAKMIQDAIKSVAEFHASHEAHREAQWQQAQVQAQQAAADAGAPGAGQDASSQQHRPLLHFGCAMDVMLVVEEVASRAHAHAHYPVNALRNLARLQARTPLVALMDVDMLPSENLVAALHDAQHADLLLKTCAAGAAYVLPAFESHVGRTATSASVADMLATTHKAALERAVAAGLAMPFDSDKFFWGHGPTNFKRWFATDAVYEVPYVFRFEPWVIVHRHLAPWHDARFRGYGYNKIQHIAHLNATGFRFLVHPSGFIVHRAHEAARARTQFIDEYQAYNQSMASPAPAAVPAAGAAAAAAEPAAGRGYATSAASRLASVLRHHRQKGQSALFKQGQGQVEVQGQGQQHSQQGQQQQGQAGAAAANGTQPHAPRNFNGTLYGHMRDLLVLVKEAMDGPGFMPIVDAATARCGSLLPWWALPDPAEQAKGFATGTHSADSEAVDTTSGGSRGHELRSLTAKDLAKPTPLFLEWLRRSGPGNAALAKQLVAGQAWDGSVPLTPLGAMKVGARRRRYQARLSRH